jgi:hypothetical protein
MHGLFQWQMNVKVLDQDLGLLDQGLSLTGCQFGLGIREHPKIGDRLNHSKTMSSFESRYFFAHFATLLSSTVVILMKHKSRYPLAARPATIQTAAGSLLHNPHFSSYG